MGYDFQNSQLGGSIHTSPHRVDKLMSRRNRLPEWLKHGVDAALYCLAGIAWIIGLLSLCADGEIALVGRKSALSLNFHSGQITGAWLRSPDEGYDECIAWYGLGSYVHIASASLSLDYLIPEVSIMLWESSPIMRMPFWLPATLVSIYPVLRIRNMLVRKIRYRDEKQCLRCGYDLRGSPTPICSECGCSITVADDSSVDGAMTEKPVLEHLVDG